MATVQNLYATVGMIIPGGRIEPGDLLTVISDDPAAPGALIIQHTKTNFRFSQQASTVTHSFSAPPTVKPHKK